MDATTGRVEDTTNDHSQEWSGDIDISQLCRVCACTNEYLIPIFQGEGLEHELENKIKKHLPLSVSESDSLPLHLCYQCASTLIAWNDLVITCIESEEKFKQLVKLPEELDNIQSGKSCNKENEAESQPSNNAELFATVVKPGDTIIFQPADAICDNPMGDTSSMLPIINSVSSIETGSINEVPSNTRYMSFRKYLLATCALREKLLMSHSKLSEIQLINTMPARKHDIGRVSADTSKYSLGGSAAPAPSEMLQLNVERCGKKHKCKICYRSFNRACDLTRHSVVHQNMSSLESLDDKCQQSIVDNKVHEETIDASKRVYLFTCEICSRMFKVKDSFERHKRIHTGERPFECPECSKRFRDSGSLSRHAKDVHAKIRNYQCSVCHKWFVNRQTLDDHHRTHTGERPYVCHKCGIMFKSRAALYQHNRTHLNYFPHVCQYCQKGFRRRQELLAHTPTHTNEKPHICDKCGKGFGTRSELRRHIIVHSDERPFVCPKCGFSFSQKRYLNSHMKSLHSRSEEVEPPPPEVVQVTNSLGFSDVL